MAFSVYPDVNNILSDGRCRKAWSTSWRPFMAPGTRMRERVPDLPVVAMSGMTALDFVSEWPELANIISLQKPFRPNELIRAIEAACRLSRPAAAENLGIA